MGKTEGQRFSGLHRTAPDDQGGSGKQLLDRVRPSVDQKGAGADIDQGRSFPVLRG
jgi:hypothetical protein